MSMEFPTHEETAAILAQRIQRTLVESGKAKEFVMLLDEHIYHTAIMLPYLTDAKAQERYIGQIDFCKGLRDGVADALEAKHSKANEET